MVATPVFERSSRVLDVAYEVGAWCYWNDNPCPYRSDIDMSEWYRGFCDASQKDEDQQATQQRRKPVE